MREAVARSARRLVRATRAHSLEPRRRSLEIVLASSSPRRLSLLRQIGLQCQVVVPEVDEEAILHALCPPGVTVSLDDAQRLTCRLAEAKAAAAIARLGQGQPGAEETGAHIAVAADTVVVCDGRLSNKPTDADDARQMLAALSGKTHHVVTGLCVRRAAESLVQAEVTAVSFRDLPSALIDTYVATGEPLDKAGGYGIQGLGGVLVRRVEGCYSNIVGLPLGRLADLLARIGVSIEQLWALHGARPQSG